MSKNSIIQMVREVKRDDGAFAAIYADAAEQLRDTVGMEDAYIRIAQQCKNDTDHMGAMIYMARAIVAMDLGKVSKGIMIEKVAKNGMSELSRVRDEEGALHMAGTFMVCMSMANWEQEQGERNFRQYAYRATGASQAEWESYMDLRTRTDDLQKRTQGRVMDFTKAGVRRASLLFVRLLRDAIEESHDISFYVALNRMAYLSDLDRVSMMAVPLHYLRRGFALGLIGITYVEECDRIYEKYNEWLWDMHKEKVQITDFDEQTSRIEKRMAYALPEMRLSRWLKASNSAKTRSQN